MNGKTYVIVVNWNSTEVTTSCLKSIYECKNDALQVVVVDNGSTDESLHALKQWCIRQSDAPEEEAHWFVAYSVTEATRGGIAPRETAAQPHVPHHIGQPLILIECGSNLGFAAANNVGTSYALLKGDSQYIWTLNNDTTIEPATLPEMVRLLNSSPTIGAVQSLLVSFSDPRKVDSCGVYFSRRSSARDDLMGWDVADLLNRMESPEQEIFGPCLASTLFKTDIFKTVGLLDENYFCIFEDADFAFRLRLSGWHSRIATRSITYHKRGLSREKGRPKDEFSDLWDFLKRRNAVALKIKFWPVRLLLWPPGFLIVSWKTVFHALQRRELVHTMRVWWAAIRFRLCLRADLTALFESWADRSLIKVYDTSQRM